VAWSEHHGGFWVLSTYEAVWSARRDHDTFSSAKYQDDASNWHGGDVIPNPGRQGMIPSKSTPRIGTPTAAS
jgi:hypothetical protein